MDTNSDHDWMGRALDLAESGLGQTGANPSVGCVLVKDGAEIAACRTGQGGRPHAEFSALQQVGAMAKGATAYVTLEPCAHEGATPSCARLLVEAGIKRVVIACEDPDPRTKGQGEAILRAGGVEVETGTGQARARQIQAGFLRRIETGMPFIGLKMATSLDGMMACANGHSQWITGDQARREGHRIRSRYDAILTGSGTVLADDPQMTVRLSGYEGAQPQRFVLDRRGRIGSKNFTVLQAEDPAAAVSQLAREYQINRVLIEAGATLTAAFIASGLVDELYWFRAPILIGADGQNPFPALGLTTVQQAQYWQPRESITLGQDVLSVYDMTGNKRA